MNDKGGNRHTAVVSGEYQQRLYDAYTRERDEQDAVDAGEGCYSGSG